MTRCTRSYGDSFRCGTLRWSVPRLANSWMKALLATLYSMLGMLIYLWFRFQLIYGVAAVVACFHDTLITVGAFALTGQEISLTVIAAILTLVGYSMNDTIVVFDRIRENLRLSRRESLPDVVNRSINQTLSRTVLTSGLTFLTVLSLYIFGGQVLKGFSFALVVGILIGTYSSIAVAAPMLVAWQEWRARQGKAAVLPAASGAQGLEKRFSARLHCFSEQFWHVGCRSIRGVHALCGTVFDAWEHLQFSRCLNRSKQTPDSRLAMFEDSTFESGRQDQEQERKLDDFDRHHQRFHSGAPDPDSADLSRGAAARLPC